MTTKESALVKLLVIQSGAQTAALRKLKDKIALAIPGDYTAIENDIQALEKREMEIVISSSST